MTDEEIERVNKYLLNAYIELCRAEKYLKKGSEDNGKRTESKADKRQ